VCGNMGWVKTPWDNSVTGRMGRMCALATALIVGLSGCVDPNSQLETTPPVEDPLVETAPLTDEEVEEDVIVEKIVYASVEECLQGNWDVNNEVFGEFFAQTDERVVAIDVSGLATMTIEDDTYRMFFEEWEIRYDTGEPIFLVSRSGNETVQFAITPDGVMEIVDRDDQVVLELFSVIGGDDGDVVAIATNDPGPLPFDGATLQCTADTLEVFVERESFLFDRR
jgi:hypothetical protein